MKEIKSKFDNWRALTETGYFKKLPDDRLALIVDGVEKIIDMHTHLGWTVMIARKIDLLKKYERTRHNFDPDLKVDLDIYMGMNFYNERPNWGKEDYIPCAISLSKSGKHHTQTVPNLVWEMDPLKIEKSVVLALDIKLGPHLSDNSRRFGEAIKKGAPDRLVFFCTVHPSHPNREKAIEESLALGAAGIKMHPEMMMTAADDPKMIDLMKLWKKMSGGKPVLFHTGFNGFEPEKARKHCAIELYYPAVEALEGVPTLIGHSAMNQYRTAIEICEKHPHCYLELSGQPKTHLWEMFDRLGPDRLVYGSDWPLYPQPLPIAKILIATEDHKEYRSKLFYDNAAKILGMK